MIIDKLEKWWSESFNFNSKTKKENKEIKESIISDEPFFLNFNDRIISKSIILYFDDSDDNKLRAEFLDENCNNRIADVLVFGTDDRYHYVKAVDKPKHNKNLDLTVLTCKATNFEFVFDEDRTLIESKHD